MPQATAMTREAIPARYQGSICVELGPTFVVRADQLVEVAGRGRHVAAARRFEQRESNGRSPLVAFEHEGIKLAVARANSVDAAAVVGREEAAAAALVGEHHQARTLEQVDETRRFGVEIHRVRRQPSNERGQRLRHHAREAGEVEMGEGYAMAPAAVAAPVAREVEVLRAVHWLRAYESRVRVLAFLP
jgi:hypothetical protein